MAKPFKIPKVQIKEDQGAIPKSDSVPKGDDTIVFSFAALEKNEYFDIDVTCQSWASELFDLLKNVSGLSKRHLLTNCRQPPYRVHNHENANPPCAWPKGVLPEDFYQISVGKSKGRIHGIFVDNVFYIIWFDPLHNLYPDDKHGGLTEIRPPKNCCMYRDEMISDLKKRIKELEEENQTLYQLLDE